MTDTVIVGILSLAGTFVGSWSGLRLMSYRIEKLEQTVAEHNNFARRMPVVEEKIEVINHRIQDIERHEEQNK
nr:MAG TPA: hypothetical protein [Caudoviricetes sp.]